MTDRFISFVNDIKKKSTPNGIASYAQKVEDADYYNLISSLQHSETSYFLIEKPVSNYRLIGWDKIISVKHSGKERILTSESEILKIAVDFVSNWDDFSGIIFPLFLGGIKFHPDNKLADDVWTDFNDSEWFIPNTIFYKYESDTYLLFNFYYNAPTSDIISQFENATETFYQYAKANKRNGSTSPLLKNGENSEDYTAWEKNIKSALEIIQNNDAEKIVLSRRVEYDLTSSPELSDLIKSLAENYPACHTFAFRQNESIFFGSSPERLASFSKGWVEADALAGSISRGVTEEQDIALANTLLESQKNINEQKAVVDFIAKSFESFTENIQYDLYPQIRKLPNIQHLWTPIRAKLKDEKSVFSLLKEIHPTPAICGVPWNKALSFITHAESHRRGLYAGIVGWFNFDNEGEFIVALRSGLLKNDRLYAFAGCGIVQGSDPEAEYKESELKLKPILSLFQNAKKG
ncbi:MAG: isochorismate synthase [Bacteroidetes bacterium]|nr:isochorismate synthase [Bacteroidota bacterium]